VTLVGAVLAVLIVITIIGYFRCPWFRKSVNNPNNLPHYLAALFTLALAVFACYAWLESQRGTAALQGQLTAMQIDQRPLMWVVGFQEPDYDDPTGQVLWNVSFANIGKAQPISLFCTRT
jgi:hypothetical protein